MMPLIIYHFVFDIWDSFEKQAITNHFVVNLILTLSNGRQINLFCPAKRLHNIFHFINLIGNSTTAIPESSRGK